MGAERTPRPRWLRKSAFALALGLVLIVAGLPASLFDALLARLSQQELRLGQTEGSLWEGRGTLAIKAGEGRWQAVMNLDWTFERAALARGELAWRFSEAGRPVLRLAASSAGWTLESVRIDLALRALLHGIPHALARAGWRGDLRIESPGLACDWRARCQGSLAFLWRNAGIDLVPRQRFGDYRLTVTSQPDRVDLQLGSLPGAAIRIDGAGQWANGRARLDAEIEGPAEIVDRLPNVLGPFAERGPRSGLAFLRLR